MTHEQIRPFIWLGWLGVITTAVNTGLSLFPSANAELHRVRDLVLLVHAPATLFPMIGLGLLGFSRAPFAAVVAIACIGLEKSTELIGQTFQLFPPSAAGDVGARKVIEILWDRMFFVLWLCNSFGASAAGWLMIRSSSSIFNRVAGVSAWLAAVLTALMLLGPDYVGWRLPGPPPWLFFLVFTAYRLALVLTLSRTPTV